MNQERFDELVRQAAETYNRSPDPPRERIWERIEVARSARSPVRRIGGRSILGFWRRLIGPLQQHPVRVLGPIGGVAALTIGILIGRMLPTDDPSRRADSGSWDRVRHASVDVRAQARSDALIQRAVAPYLGRIEALLTLVESDGHLSPSDGSIAAWAEDLLADTRMLRDSPVREDEELRSLLDDLELVLARIVRLSSRQGVEARPWIRESIRDRSILLRVRGRLPAGETGGGA